MNDRERVDDAESMVVRDLRMAEGPRLFRVELTNNAVGGAMFVVEARARDFDDITRVVETAIEEYDPWLMGAHFGPWMEWGLEDEDGTPVDDGGDGPVEVEVSGDTA